MLKELNLQLEFIPPGPLAQPAAQQAEAPQPAPPSHGGGGSGQGDLSAGGGSSGFGNVPLGLMASASRILPSAQEYDLNDDSCWARDKEGLDYGVNPKLNVPLSGYMPSALIASVTYSQVVPQSSLLVDSPLLLVIGSILPLLPAHRSL